MELYGGLSCAPLVLASLLSLCVAAIVRCVVTDDDKGPALPPSIIPLAEKTGGKDSAPEHVTFRCVSCSRAFCDSCSSGAAFDAIADHPVWGPSGFTLPPYYEYVRCAICVDSLLKETTRARRSK